MSEPLPTHGLHDDIDEQAYHADPASLSSSKAKGLIYDGPDAVLEAAQGGPVYLDTFDMGSVIHALVLGVGDFEVLGFDSWRKKEAREQRLELRSQGVAPILRKDYEQAMLMAAAVHKHPRAVELMSTGKPEVSMWARDPMTDVLMRGRVDWWNGSVIDLKTTSGQATHSSWVQTVWSFKYAFQFAYYNRILELNDIEPGRPEWIVVSKQEPYEVAVFAPSAELMRRAEIDVDRALWLYCHVKATGLWPPLAAAQSLPGVGVPPRGSHIPFLESVEEDLTQT